MKVNCEFNHKSLEMIRMKTQYRFVILVLGIIIILSLISILYAFMLLKRLKRIKVEHEQINTIASYIKEGAVAYMKRQYKVMFIVDIYLCYILILIGFITSLKDAEVIGFRSSVTFIIGVVFLDFQVLLVCLQL